MRFLDKSMGADFLLIPQSIVLAGGNVGADAGLALAMRDTPGIEEVTTLRVAIAGDRHAAASDRHRSRHVSASGRSRVRVEHTEQAYAEIGAGRDILNGIFTGRNNVQLMTRLRPRRRKAIALPRGRHRHGLSEREGGDRLHLAGVSPPTSRTSDAVDGE
jgi:hypothetical protein